MHSKAFTYLGKSSKKEEQVPDGPTTKYSQGIQNSCIISSLASSLYYMGDELVSEYIIRRKQQYIDCINVCGKWIFDSNLEFALPLTKASLNYICSGNDTDEITFVGVLHAIRAFPPIVVQIKLNI